MVTDGPNPDEHDYRECTNEDCPHELCRSTKRAGAKAMTMGMRQAKPRGT